MDVKYLKKLENRIFLFILNRDGSILMILDSSDPRKKQVPMNGQDNSWNGIDTKSLIHSV